NSNPRFKLINLDYQDISELEEEDQIDKLVGLISLDSGKNALSLEKLRFILSSLNLNYRDAKYISNPKIEKQKLRQTLKKFVRSSIDNTLKVEAVLEELDKAEVLYNIKEMIRFQIIT